jgi:hypothetical protein
VRKPPERPDGISFTRDRQVSARDVHGRGAGQRRTAILRANLYPDSGGPLRASCCYTTPYIHSCLEIVWKLGRLRDPHRRQGCCGLDIPVGVPGVPTTGVEPRQGGKDGPAKRKARQRLRERLEEAGVLEGIEDDTGKVTLYSFHDIAR